MPEESSERTAEGTIIVFAAGTLQDAFKELAETFEEQNPGSDVRFNFGESSALLTQIQQGAPADTFASADATKMETAVEEGLVEEPRVFAHTKPVIIVPEGNPAGIQQLQDLAKPGAKITLMYKSAPLGEYTDQILKRADSLYGNDFYQKVMENVVSREGQHRAPADKVALGEADATFVYNTDVESDLRDKVQIVEIPEDLNVIPDFPIAVTTDASNPNLAQRWVDLLLSSEGQQVLEKWGFESAS